MVCSRAPEADEQWDHELVGVEDDGLGAVHAPLGRGEDRAVGPVEGDEVAGLDDVGRGCNERRDAVNAKAGYLCKPAHISAISPPSL